MRISTYQKLAPFIGAVGVEAPSLLYYLFAIVSLRRVPASNQFLMFGVVVVTLLVALGVGYMATRWLRSLQWPDTNLAGLGFVFIVYVITYTVIQGIRILLVALGVGYMATRWLRSLQWPDTNLAGLGFVFIVYVITYTVIQGIRILLFIGGVLSCLWSSTPCNPI